MSSSGYNSQSEIFMINQDCVFHQLQIFVFQILSLAIIAVLHHISVHLFFYLG